MNDFIQEINLLQKDGIHIDEKKYAVQLKHIICDIQARKFLKQIKGHGGYAACERCEVYGKCITYPNQRVVYPDPDCTKRSNESFRRQQQKEHHISISPLLHIEPPIDMIHAFPLDYMHMCCLGVTKKFYVMDLIFNKTAVKLTSSFRQKLFKRIIHLKPFVPHEFQRKPRPFVPNLKASELRFIALYAGPIIFKGILNRDLYNHFLLFSIALRILCMENFAQKFNDAAKSYLKNYFLLLPTFYGEKSHVLNAHYLLHLADDVRIHNCTLNEISAFPFENHLGLMRNFLHSANKPLSQICRRMHKANIIINQKTVIPPKLIILKQKDIDNNHKLLLKLKYQNFLITTKSPNDLVMLNDCSVIKIVSLGYYCENENDITISGVYWMKKKSIFEYPTNSAHLYMWQLKKTVQRRHCV
ncbi:hypothetical protein ALC57_16916 [Trachymyrmex cornetzi]|uniref:Uncharacterized protein n=1 Tax=Trachymyrmex cornetzi TaxID=471704 RepID=A0A151IU33_9HYME|nr:hypothetical protein ALC57_16916 [Trachymyrmex cornetzi]